MGDQVKAGDLLKWTVGFWKFMKKNGYVEADMTFETFYPFRDVGTATFRTIAVEQQQGRSHKVLSGSYVF